MSRPAPGSARDLIELILGFGLIVFVLWMPEFPQHILSPVALVVTLTIVLARRPSLEDLGISWRGLVPSLWILPAAIVLVLVSLLVAKHIGTLHPLYKGDFKHIAGYVLWTLYQQFLLNDLFMPRLTRLLASENAVRVSLEAIQALGGAGYLKDFPVERYLRDAKAGWVMGPTNEVLRQFVGKAVLLGFDSLDYWNQTYNRRAVENELKKLDAEGKRKLAEELMTEVEKASAPA